MASTTQRRDGRWETIINLGGGKRRRFYGRTAEIAQAKMRAAFPDPLVAADGLAGRFERPGIAVEPGKAITVTMEPGQRVNLGDIKGLLERRGLDPADWQIGPTKVNEWEGFAVIDKRIVKTTNTQLKVTLTPSVKMLMPKAARLDGPKYLPQRRSLREQAMDDRIIGQDAELVVILPDQQIPFHDETLHELVCEWLAYNKPDRMILSGDFYDFPSVSRHPKKAHELKMGGVQECLDVGYRIARDYVESAGPTCYDRRIVPGNHEYRLQRVILDTLPELYNLHRAGDDQTKVFGLSHLSRLDELGFTWAADPVYEEDYPQGHVNLTDKLAVYHGWVARPQSGASALKTLEHLGHSVIVGHTHRQADVAHTFHEIDGKLRILRGIEAGTLARVKGGLGYSVAPNWQSGFATVRLFPNGMFNVELAKYINGVLLWGDQQYFKRSLRGEVAA